MNNDLISRSALLKKGRLHDKWDPDMHKYETTIVLKLSDIDDALAVDAEVVRHSMWLEHPSSQNTRYWTCLNCDTVGSPRWKRCPMCECKMDAEVEG